MRYRSNKREKKKKRRSKQVNKQTSVYPPVYHSNSKLLWMTLRYDGVGEGKLVFSNTPSASLSCRRLFSLSLSLCVCVCVCVSITRFLEASTSVPWMHAFHRHRHPTRPGCFFSGVHGPQQSSRTNSARSQACRSRAAHTGTVSARATPCGRRCATEGEEPPASPSFSTTPWRQSTRLLHSWSST